MILIETKKINMLFTGSEKVLDSMTTPVLEQDSKAAPLTDVSSSWTPGSLDRPMLT